MLVLRGKKIIQQIFADHFDKFTEENEGRLRPGIVKNVDKVIKCGTEEMGFHLYKCGECGGEKKVAHTCKSRFCSSCGVAQTDTWIERYTTLFANCQYQHVIFSPPSEFRIYFRVGRKPYFDGLYEAVNQTLFDWYSLRGYFPGGMSVLHTFGRDIKWHVHIHVLLTCGGLDRSETKWTPNAYLPHLFLKDHFKQHFLTIIQKLWEKEKIEEKIKTIAEPLRVLFTSVYQQRLLKQVDVTWYVHIGERLKNAQFVVRYIGRYTKRPAIAESRITGYDGSMVTFSFKEHRMTEKALLTLSVFDFIERLIVHIPDVNFRIIRYFGFYSNRVRGELLPKVFAIFKQSWDEAKKKLKALSSSWWRERIKRLCHLDPLTCSVCLIPLSLISVVYTQKKSTL